MKRFQAIRKAYGVDYPALDSSFWVVWDWKHKRVYRTDGYLTRYQARKLAKKLSQHDWLIDR